MRERPTRGNAGSNPAPSIRLADYRRDMMENATERSEDECPRCGAEGIQNPILDDWYECNRCLISFSADGEVDEGE